MEIIKITQHQGNQSVSARELHQFLEVESKFADWIKNRINEYGFIENEDFLVFLKNEKKPQGGRSAKEYALTLDMAKELAMVEKTKKGRQARKYFIAMEKQARQNAMIVPASVVSNGVTCISYLHWLLQNGYSTFSGSVSTRIRKHPKQFVKSGGLWYISTGLAQYYEYQKNPKKFVESLPTANPLQQKLF